MGHIVKRAISFFVGLFILSLGISCSIIADIGAGAWDALNVGLSLEIGLTVGMWVIIVGVLLIFINAFILGKKPAFISMINVIVVGYFIDFWLLIIFPNVVVSSLYGKFGILSIGILLMGIGIATYLQARFAAIPIDGFMIALQTRLNVSLMVAKTIGEVLALILAFIVGGPIGIGTIFVTFLIGPIIQIVFPHIEGIVHGRS